ncbi:beta-ketoacyl synthase N-terminal-like domain-containing protein [Streptomyces sp. NPDC059785]|uniref:beta-ketoacyl synthase N-terminal-like domain-containing protein n=1 Tax=Streptomyces sp. NPDC059785 TaxID=3346945 RepID=UPI00365524CB
MNGSDDGRSVAVIGMACRLPGAPGTDELWELLCGGIDATSETPPERYDVDTLYSPRRRPGRIGSRRAGYVDEVADFDAEFFGMSATEAVELDPQQRLLLMTAYEALEDAGQRPDLLAGSRTGVFVGNARSDYLESAFRQGLDAVTAAQFHNFRSLIPARLSYEFDFRGPSEVIDTACSSSLVAVHRAVQSLRAGEIPLALAAGVNIKLRPDEGVLMTQAGTLAADGRSKFADADADGHAPSDAVAVVVLKPLGLALADGDRIRAVVRGSAVGNDGRTSDSVLNPSLAGQVEVLRWAYADAGVEPGDVDYVEAHGAGSPALDALELRALGEVLGRGRPAERPLLVGSVKTNIGHAEAAGSLAGLIKAVLCLEHGQVPPSLHLATPRPDVDWAGLPLAVPGQVHDLPDLDRPALAGVSGQGSSALNAHVVLGQASRPAAPPEPVADGAPYVLALSARSPAALAELVRAYAAYLAPDGPGAEHPVRDICWSAALRRQHHEHRAAVVGSSHEELAAALAGAAGPARPKRQWRERGALLAAVADLYRAGAAVDWGQVFGLPGRYVPLPRYPWQTRRFWPGEESGTDGGADGGDLASRVLREHARTRFDDGSALTDIGIDSLAKLRIVVELNKISGGDIDPEEFGRLRTVGELRRWTRALEAPAR